MAERAPLPPPEEVEAAEIEFQEEVTPSPAPLRPRRASREYPTPPPPPTERVRVADQEYEVPPAVAVQVRQWEQAQARLDAIERAHQASEQWRQGVERAVSGEQPPPQDELETLWFSNPREAARRLQEQVTQQVEARYQARESTQAFWGTFEGEYPELGPQRKLVQYLLATEPGLGQLPNSPEGRSQLAKAAREWGLSAMQGARQSGTAPVRQQVPPVETGTRRRSAAPAPRPEPAQPQSMTEFRRARKEQRREHRLRLVQGES
jgi:hypothetical protein